MAEEAVTHSPTPSLPSTTPQSTISPFQPPQEDASTVNPQSTQTRTIGGFVDDEEDDEENENDKALDESEYDPNIDGGLSATPPQQDIHPPSSDAPAPLSPSHPDSSVANTTSVLNNAHQEQELKTEPEPEQSLPSSEPAKLQTTSRVPISNGPVTDPVLSPSMSSHPAAVGRASLNPTPLNAAANVSRPTTANGASDQSPTTVAPSARLPSDRVGILEDRIREDTKGDTDAWLSLIDEHKRRGKIAEVRGTYDRFLAIFPNNADQWNAYVTFELDQDRFREAEAILQKCVGNLQNLGLWTTYLNYIRRRHPVSGSNAENNRKTVEQVFSFVLEGVGIDRDAGRLWQDYIEFLKFGPGILGGADWQDKQKMDTVRKAYQTAIAIPTEAVETLWKEYDKFEMDLNKMTGRKNLQEKSPDYMTARSFNMTLRNVTRGLIRSTTPNPPPMPGCEGYEEYLKQVGLWKQWIALEKEDPLCLSEEDRVDEMQKRVLYVYKQASMSLRFWPEIWFEAAQYCFEIDQAQKGDAYLDQGLDANPESCLLAFKKAERIESTTTGGDNEAIIKERGNKVRAPFDKCLDALYALIAANADREKAAVAQVREKYISIPAAIMQTGENGDEDQDARGEKADPNVELQQRIDAVSQGAKEQEELLKKLINATWIALMRAMRRVQGKGNPSHEVKGMRGVLVEARRRGRLNSDFYIASALLEQHCYNDPTAGKIFERGFKLFPNDEQFAMEYIKFQINVNDMTNARVTFETVVNNLTQKNDPSLSEQEKEVSKMKAKPVFALFHHYESLYGELDQIKKLEQRMNTLYPEDPKLFLFEQRFARPNFDPCTAHPVISPQTQTRAKIQNLIEQITKQPLSVQGSPLTGKGRRRSSNETLPKSPKRVREDSDAEGPARKVARGESPLKGAAGRRLDAVRRTGLANEVSPQQTPALPAQPPPPTIPPAIYTLLGKIPPAHTYHATRLDAHKMVQLLSGVDLTRNNINARRQNPAQQQPIMPMQAPPPLAYPQTPNPQAIYQQQQQPTPQPNYGHQGFFAPPPAYSYTR